MYARFVGCVRVRVVDVNSESLVFEMVHEQNGFIIVIRSRAGTCGKKHRTELVRFGDWNEHIAVRHTSPCNVGTIYAASVINMQRWSPPAHYSSSSPRAKFTTTRERQQRSSLRQDYNLALVLIIAPVRVITLRAHWAVVVVRASDTNGRKTCALSNYCNSTSNICIGQQ